MTFNFEDIIYPKDKEVKCGSEVIVVRQYVPIEEKLAAIQSILELSLNPETGMYLRGHVYVYKLLYTFYLYTNLEFSDEAKDQPMKLYDAITNSPYFSDIKAALSSDHYEFYTLLEDTIAQFETYQTSAYGILDSMSKDYNNLNFDIEALQNKIKNRENIELVDEIVTKLG